MMKTAGTVVIIGAGVAGLAMAEALLRRGIRDLIILERADSPGGVWHANTYPGVACDVPADNYAYRFARNPNWSQRLAPGQEIAAYLSRVFDRLGLRTHTRFGTEVTDCRWDGAGWQVTARSRSGEQFLLQAISVVAATGILRVPKHPPIPGLGEFGPVVHTARWDKEAPVNGTAVGVIGTGASAIQAIPHLAKSARQLTVFMRTPPWVVPMSRHFAIPALRRMIRTVPGAYDVYCKVSDEALLRAYAGIFTGASPITRNLLRTTSRLWLFSLRDKALREKLRPSYPMGTKRILYSTSFYRAMQQPNVTLVTEPITAAAAGQVRTDDRVYALDALVLATGFESDRFVDPVTVTGRNEVTLEEIWDGTPYAFRGVMVPGLPSFYMLLGPSSPIGSTSNTHVAEWQADYVATCIAEESRTKTALMPTETATRIQRAIDDRAASKSVWNDPSVTNWYRTGRNNLMFSARPPSQVRREMRHPDWSEFTALSRLSNQSLTA